MATVYIQKRKRNSYIIYYKDPSTGKNKYYKTYPKQKEAQTAANDLRALLDTGRIPKRKIKELTPLNFSGVGTYLVKDRQTKLKNRELSEVT